MTKLLLRAALATALLGATQVDAFADDRPRAKAEPEKVELWRDMAQWYIDNHMTDQALEMVARLRQAGELSPELDLIQARAFVAQGMPEEARHMLEQLTGRMPKDARPLQSLGVVYADLGEYELAISALQRALEMEPSHAPTQNNLGFLLLGLDRCEEAATALERAVELDATNGRYRNNLAFSLVCLGDPQRALKLFRSTGTEADARYNLGSAYERLGKYPSAILQFQEALDAAPTHARAKEAMDRLAPLGLIPGEAAPPASPGAPTNTPDPAEGAQP